MRSGGFILITCALLFSVAKVQAAADIWQDISVSQRLLANGDAAVSYYLADEENLRRVLMRAPHERVGDRSYQIELPMPDGELALFSVVESPILSDLDASAWPDFRTFKVFGVDDPHASGRLSLTALGFHGLVHGSKGRVFIDPPEQGAQSPAYRSRYNDRVSNRQFNCGVTGAHDPLDHLELAQRASAQRTEGNLLEYDLAVAVTLEYHNFFGGTLGTTVSAVMNTINRVREIYERDLGITFVLVGTTGEIYEQSESNMLNNESASALLDAATNWIDSRLPGGNSMYDIGHMFSRPDFGGGVAFLGVVCDNGFKGGGVTGLPTPSGDLFDIDFVAHEIGHQFNADHSFNGSANACAQRNAATAFEPGGGSTIMAYAGICGAENIATFSDATFHAGSIAQIDAFAWSGAGNACATDIVVANSDPVIGTATVDRDIPINTPFMLDNTSATDTDALSYQWDQMNAGMATNATTFGTDLGDNALFRSYEPRSVSFRNFPALSTQLNNEFDDAEVLPCKTRNIDMRLTVRDNASGQAVDNVRLRSTTTSGPFRVTSQPTAATIVPNSGAITVNWEVANTTSAPVSCPAVDIELLTFNTTKSNYSVQQMEIVKMGTPNDGVEVVTLPDIRNENARIRVKCSNNIFYDISDADLNITGTTPVMIYDIPVALPNPSTSDSNAPNCPIVNTGGEASSGSDSGAVNIWWLLLLSGLAATIKLLRSRHG